jgi:beta-galactosidase
VLHIYPHWSWPERVGEEIELRVQTNFDDVELLVNGTSLGRKTVGPNSSVSWKAKYTPGAVVARGYRAGRIVKTTRLETTGAPTKLKLTADRVVISADGRDVAVVSVDVRDAAGRIVPTAAEKVRFSVSGPARIIGVGNGDPSSLEPDRYVESVRAMSLGELQRPEAEDDGDRPVIFERTFDRPAVANAEEITLLLSALGATQSAYLNDQPLYEDVDATAARAAIRLDSDKLLPQANRLRIQAKPFEAMQQRERLRQLQPAVLRIRTPAGIWSRTTFNGFAQVIVQSTGEPGKIVLRATSDIVRGETISLTAR